MQVNVGFHLLDSRSTTQGMHIRPAPAAQTATTVGSSARHLPDFAVEHVFFVFDFVFLVAHKPQRPTFLCHLDSRTRCRSLQARMRS